MSKQDQLQIGEMVCRILDEFKDLPQITKLSYGCFMCGLQSPKGPEIIVEESLEACLAEFYNLKKNIQEGVNAGGGHD